MKDKEPTPLMASDQSAWCRMHSDELAGLRVEVSCVRNDTASILACLKGPGFGSDGGLVVKVERHEVRIGSLEADRLRVKTVLWMVGGGCSIGGGLVGLVVSHFWK